MTYSSLSEVTTSEIKHRATKSQSKGPTGQGGAHLLVSPLRSKNARATGTSETGCQRKASNGFPGPQNAQIRLLPRGMRTICDPPQVENRWSRVARNGGSRWSRTWTHPRLNESHFKAFQPSDLIRTMLYKPRKPPGSSQKPPHRYPGVVEARGEYRGGQRPPD